MKSTPFLPPDWKNKKQPLLSALLPNFCQYNLKLQHGAQKWHQPRTKNLSSTLSPAAWRSLWYLSNCYTGAPIAMNGLTRVSTAELTTEAQPRRSWKSNRQGDAVEASLVSPGNRLEITNKMSMLSCSPSTFTLTMMSLINLRLSTAGLIRELCLVAMN